MSQPLMMREIAISSFGGPEVLTLVTSPVPTAKAGEILVRVHAAGVNRPDVLQRLGKYPLPPGAHPTPGLEIAGEVVGLGSGVSQWHVGDRVCGLTNGGGYAEYCTVPAGQALAWPAGFSSEQAAALPETFFTVWANLFQLGRAARGETVLAHGGTSGIGTTVIQLSKIFGLNVIATAGSDEKCAAINRLGAAGVNYRTQDFVEIVRQMTAGRGVDVVVDIVGAAYFERNLQVLARDGRLLLIGFLGGSVVENVDLAKIMARRILITGLAMRPRSIEEKAGIARELRDQVWPHLGPGRIEPVLHTTFPLERAADAHRLMESHAHIGKIVLKIA